MPKTINLEKYATPGVGVLAGRQRGELVRKEVDLDHSDAEPEEVTVIVPDFIFSINSSFFLGLFGNSIRRLGAEEFRRLFHFEGRNLKPFVEDGIRQALRTGSPLTAASRRVEPTPA